MLSFMSVNATERRGGLGAVRRAGGLSQQRVAELAGCSVGYVRLLESGYRPQNASEVLPLIWAVLTTSTLGKNNSAADADRTAG